MESLKVKIRSRYSPHDPDKYGFATTGDSMTNQQFKEECDVNNILAKYKRTGLLSHVSRTQGQFGDFSTLEDYQTSLHKVMKAQESFGLLPSEVRNKFQNDPGKLVDFLADSKNDEEAYKFGLKIKPVVEDSMEMAFAKALASNDQRRNQSKKPKNDE